MKITRSSFCVIGLLLLAVVAGCSPTDPKSRIQSAISTLTSDASSSRKAEACNTLSAALAEIPSEEPGRGELAAQATTALENAVLGSDKEVRNAAIQNLANTDGYLQATMDKLIISDDPTVRERAEKLFTTMGSRATPLLALAYISTLEPFEDAKPGIYGGFAPISAGNYDPYEGIPGMKRMSESGQERMMAFVRIFGDVGDEASVLALLTAAASVRNGHPNFSAENWKALEALGPEKIALLPDEAKSTYQALKASEE